MATYTVRHYVLIAALLLPANVHALNWFQNILLKTSKLAINNVVGPLLILQVSQAIINFLMSQIANPNNIKFVKLMTQVHNAKLPKHIKAKVLATLCDAHSAQDQHTINSVTEFITYALRYPWKIINQPQTNLKRIESTLNAALFGMHEAKNTILDIIFAYNSGVHMKMPVICLVGPPGVGKTAFATAVAQALNLPSIVISATGLRDADIFFRGSNRAYNKAKPGFFVNAFTSCGCRNPVVVIDEIDKVATGSSRGNIQDVLLQVFDPLQNKIFRDHYLDMPIDVSGPLYITTANKLSSISEPLQDRMFIIEIPNYTEKERTIIANTIVWHSISLSNSIPGPLRKKMIETALEKTVSIRDLKKHLTQAIIRWARTHDADSAPKKT